jgi:DNA-binding transcriptional LysR family regulator
MLQLDTLDLRRLRAFHLVAKHGSLRVAATRLAQSIPAISAKIRKLETELGFDLFERLPNKLVLTIAGERFLHEVDGIFERAEQALASLNATAPEGRLTMSVGSDHAWFYAPKIRRFLNRYPKVSLSLRVYKSADAVVAIDQGDIDVGFGIFPELPKRLERMVIETTTLSIAYNPAEIPQTRRKPTRLADLGRQRIIVPPGSTATRRFITGGVGREWNQDATVIEAPTCETAATFVEMGVGVAFVHTLCVERHRSRHVHTIDLGSKGGELAFCAVYRKRSLSLPLVDALLDEIKQSGN